MTLADGAARGRAKIMAGALVEVPPPPGFPPRPEGGLRRSERERRPPGGRGDFVWRVGQVSGQAVGLGNPEPQPPRLLVRLPELVRFQWQSATLSARVTPDGPFRQDGQADWWVEVRPEDIREQPPAP